MKYKLLISVLYIFSNSYVYKPTDLHDSHTLTQPKCLIGVVELVALCELLKCFIVGISNMCMA